MPNGSLCPKCRSKDEQSPINTGEILACLIGHRGLDGLLLFRAGGLEFTRRFDGATKDDYDLTNEERSKRTDELNIPTIGSPKVIAPTLIDINYIPPLPVIVKKFTPQEGDVFVKNWVGANGEKKSVHLPPYGIADVHQFLDRFRGYLAENYKIWARVAGRPFSVVLTVIESEEVPNARSEFFRDLLLFILAALHKTSTDYLAGEETLDTPVIHEAGHRLDGRRVSPRMVAAQMDPLSTLNILIPAQKSLIGKLTDLLESDDAQNWGDIFISLAALSKMATIQIADRKRHGKDNSIKGLYTVPGFVVDLAAALTILIARFHKYETRVGRDEGVKLSDPAIKEYYDSLEALDGTGEKKFTDEDIDDLDWWLSQLVTKAGDWVPRPTPFLVDDE